MPGEGSKKRARGEDEGETQHSVGKKPNDSYTAMKAAWANKDYQEAIKICSEALKDATLSTNTRYQFLLARCTLYQKIGDSYSLTLRDSKAAICLAPNHAMVSIG
jgi:hypothetical protein